MQIVSCGVGVEFFREEFTVMKILLGGKSDIQSGGWPATTTPTPHDIICSMQSFIANLLAVARQACQLKRKHIGI